MDPSDPDLLVEQADYYRARAREYDDWWMRLGRYDRGAEATARWRAEVVELDAAISRSDLSGDVLELACGTGWWTERLARSARRRVVRDHCGQPDPARTRGASISRLPGR